MIQFDNWAENTAAGSGAGTDTISFTNNGTILLAACMLDSLETVTAVGYNANLLTQIYQTTIDTACTLWVGYIIQPTLGTHNLVFNFSGGVSTYRTGCISFSGVKETDPIGGSTSLTRTHDNTTPLPTTVTVQAPSGMIVSFTLITRSLSTQGNAASPQIEKMNNFGTWSATENHVAGISYEPHTGSNITMTWENWTHGSGTNNQQQYAVELKDAGFVPRIHMF